MSIASIAVTPLLPVTIEPGGFRYAPGVRAGRWVFATGLKGVAEFDQGIAAHVVRAALPSHDASKLQREARQVFANLERVCAAGGTALTNVVRVDQNYTTHKAVEPYHDIRREVLGAHIPPSTSTLTHGLLLADQQIEMHMIAAVPDGGFATNHIRPKDAAIHHTSGYSLALAAGDHVFIAGRMADGGIGEGLAPQARMPAKHLWKGTPVKLEAEYVIANKLVRALEAADCSLADIVKLQVYLQYAEDFAPFNDVWRAHFGASAPATTLVPTASPGFFLEDAHIEINAIALRPTGRERREVIAVEGGGLSAFGGYPQAVRAGDLLLFSGMLAIDEDGLIAAARRDPAKPWMGDPIRAQMQTLLARAQCICEAAGTTLANVVRIQQYHTDLGEFQAACDVWGEVLPGVALPLSAVRVPFLPVPGCTVQLDVWVYVP
ncbi:MAG: hypothetical protein H7125_09600 [Proteobacteria bacterium]|nr:hypothetical protein [Burkholderiales bacterium]